MSAKPHPYAHILTAIAQGLNVQWQNSYGDWHEQDYNITLSEISVEHYSPDRYRVAPRTITINGHEVPEPLRELPAEGATVYWVGFGPGSSDDLTEQCDVGYYPTLLPELLKMGLLHSTRDAAQAHAKALISFTEVK